MLEIYSDLGSLELKSSLQKNLTYTFWKGLLLQVYCLLPVRVNSNVNYILRYHWQYLCLCQSFIVFCMHKLLLLIHFKLLYKTIQSLLYYPCLLERNIYNTPNSNQPQVFKKLLILLQVFLQQSPISSVESTEKTSSREKINSSYP